MDIYVVQVYCACIYVLHWKHRVCLSTAAADTHKARLCCGPHGTLSKSHTSTGHCSVHHPVYTMVAAVGAVVQGGGVSVTATVTVTLLLEPGAVNVLCSLHVTSVTCRLPLLLVILVVATSRPDSTRACLCRNPLYELLLKDVFPACLRQRLLPAGGRHGPSRNSSKDRVDFALNFTVLEYDFVSLLKQPLVSLQYFLSITGLVVATENLVGNVKNIVQTDGIHLSSACSNLNVKDRSITDRFP